MANGGSETGDLEHENAGEALSQDLTEKLLHFQQITNIDDLDKCKRILRQHAWNVENAVQSTFVDGSQPEPQRNVTPALRRRNINSISSPIPLRNLSRTSVYEARRSVNLRQPQGVLGWSYYLLAFPFRFTWTTLFGIVRFFIRLFLPDNRMRLINPLEDVQEFVAEYEDYYGTRHPEFFRGTYADVQNESKRRMKFLLVYLHDPDQEDTDDFCKETLSNSDVIEFVERNFVFWACSIEKPEGYRVSRAMRENTHPFMATICPVQGKMTVVGRFEGPLTSQEHTLSLVYQSVNRISKVSAKLNQTSIKYDHKRMVIENTWKFICNAGALEFLEQVSAIVDRFEPVLIAVRAERAERDMTQQIRNEQDVAYEQSLMQDKEKEEKKRMEEEIRQKKEEELIAKQRQKEEVEENFIRRRQSCKDLLGQEADSSDPDALKLVIKLPDGSRLTRVFLSTQPVKAIHDYIFSQDNAPRQFQVVQNFPRKIIPGSSTSEILASEENTNVDATTKPKFVEADDLPLANCDRAAAGELGISIAEAGLKSCETIFVQALDDTDDEDSAA